MKNVSVTRARKDLSSIIKGLSRGGRPITITKRGRPAAVVVSVDELEGLTETIEILSDPAAMRAIREGQRDIARGRVRPWEEVKARLGV